MASTMAQLPVPSIIMSSLCGAVRVPSTKKSMMFNPTRDASHRFSSQRLLRVPFTVTSCAHHCCLIKKDISSWRLGRERAITLASDEGKSPVLNSPAADANLAWRASTGKHDPAIVDWSFYGRCSIIPMGHSEYRRMLLSIGLGTGEMP